MFGREANKGNVEQHSLEIMKPIIGTKEYMTQVFAEDGTVTPVTALKATPATVLQVKTPERDGYQAVQIASGERKTSRIPKPLKGHFGDRGNFRYVREFRANKEAFEEGAELTVEQFEPGERVRVSAISKGKGFQGVVKRHGFHGGPRSHGQKHSEREIGSIGATGPQRVMKGKKMAGRMGGERITKKSLTVVRVDPESHTLFVKGAVPGRRGAVVEISGE